MMKDSGIEWIGQIPQEWEMSYLKYLISNYRTGPFGSSLRIDRILDNGNILNDILIYAPEHIAKKTVELPSNTYLPKSRETEMQQYFVSAGDIIFPIVGTLGRAMEITAEMPRGIINSRLAKLKLNETCINKSFFMWLFAKSEFFYPYIDLNTHGAIILNLTKELFGSMPLPLPPISEQKRIADFLDRKSAEIDAVIKKTEESIEEYKKLKQSVITEAVTKGIRMNRKMKPSGIEWIGDIPEEWKLMRAKFCFRQRSEKGNRIEEQLLSPTQKYGVIPQSLYDEISGMKAVKLDENIDFNSLKGIYKGDFCISLRSFQGGFEYSEYNGVVSPAYQVFYASSDSIYNYYYKRLFKEKGFIDKMASLTKSFRDGKNIAFDDFANSLIPIPSIDEQKEIADFLDRKSAEIDKLIEAKQKLLEEMQTYKKSVIYEYVTGKKEV